MKNLILAFSTMFAFTTASFAQNAPAEATIPAVKTKPAKGQGKDMSEKGKGQMGEKGQGQMGGNLGLSPDQETKFKALNVAQKDAVKAVQMDDKLSADAKKTQIDALKGKYEADVKGVMNADQYSKWMAMRAKRSEKATEHKEKMEDHKANANEGDAKAKMSKGMKGKAKSDKAAAPQGATKSE